MILRPPIFTLTDTLFPTRRSSDLSVRDRTLISLLIEPIKSEFALSDTQIGALIGFGFVIFYSVLGLPFGALADRANRRNLILFGLVAWSLATSASGFAGGRSEDTRLNSSH